MRTPGRRLGPVAAYPASQSKPRFLALLLCALCVLVAGLPGLAISLLLLVGVAQFTGRRNGGDPGQDHETEPLVRFIR
jgi:quinol-cytochrome oxidoreductase complex cytochrome b subunit